MRTAAALLTVSAVFFAVRRTRRLNLDAPR